MTQKTRGCRYHLLSLAVFVVLFCAASAYGFEPWKGVVLKGVNLRTGPRLDAEIITVLYPAEKVTVKGEHKGWYRVLPHAEGTTREGWMYSKFLSPLGNTPNPTDKPAVEEEAATDTSPAPKHQETTQAPKASETIPLHQKRKEGEKKPLKETEEGPKAADKDPLYLREGLLEKYPKGEVRHQKKKEPGKTARLPLRKEEKAFAPPSEKPKPVAPPSGEVSLTGQMDPLFSPGLGSLLRGLVRVSCLLFSCLALILSFKALHTARSIRHSEYDRSSP